LKGHGFTRAEEAAPAISALAAEGMQLAGNTPLRG